jgi:hypothetical protein
MKRILACLAVALGSVGAATAQPGVQIMDVEAFNGCKDLMITNNSDREYHIIVTYHYNGKLYGRPNVHTGETGGVSPPRSTITISAQTVMIDCKEHYTFKFQSRWEDLTAKREEIDRSREAVIRAYLEAEEAKKRQAEDYARKQQAEAESRQRQAAEQQAARDAAAQRGAQARQSQLDYEMDSVRQIVAAGDPRCRQLVSPGTTPQEIIKSHQECTRNVQRHDSNLPRYEIGRIDPAICNLPTISLINASTPEMQAEAQRKAEQMVAECVRARGGAMATPAFAGPDPAVLEAQRLREEQAEAQRQYAMEQAEIQRQLDAQAAALEAERLAMIRQNAQQSMTQSTNDLRAANADFARQSQSIADANAELEAFLNGN